MKRGRKSGGAQKVGPLRLAPVVRSVPIGAVLLVFVLGATSGETNIPPFCCETRGIAGQASMKSARAAVAAPYSGLLDASGFPPTDAWTDAAPVHFDTDWQGKNADPLRSTEVRLLWTAEHLYLKFVSRYRVITVFSDAQPNGRRDKLWDRDVAEVFLHPDPSALRQYKEFEVSPNGFWIDLDIHDGALADLKSGLRRRILVEESAKTWAAELAIPMNSLVQHFDPARRLASKLLSRRRSNGAALLFVLAAHPYRATKFSCTRVIRLSEIRTERKIMASRVLFSYASGVQKPYSRAVFGALGLFFLAMSLSAALLSPTCAAPAQNNPDKAPTVTKVEPPGWWIGLTPEVMLLLSGHNLQATEVTCNLPTVRVSRTQSSAGGDYLFVWLKIGADTRSGTAVCRITTSTGNVSFELPLPQRSATPGKFQGLSQSDVMYLIMPDRFANGDPTNDQPPEAPGSLIVPRRGPITAAIYGGFASICCI